MGTRRTRDLPAALEGVRRRFEHWRRKQKTRSRIPDSLWAAAVRVAITCGLHRTCRALRMDYYSLKDRVEQHSSVTPHPAGTAAGAAFLEWLPPADHSSAAVSVARNGVLLHEMVSTKVARGVAVLGRSPLHPLMVQAKPTIVELDMNKLEEILRRLEAKELGAEDYETIKAVVGSYVYLVNAVGEKETTIRRLRQMLFGAKTEKTEAVIGGSTTAGRTSASSEAGTESLREAHAAAEASDASRASDEPPEKSPGHGRNGAGV